MSDIVSNVSHVQKVKGEHEKCLDACVQKIQQWEKFKSDYVALRDRLNTFADKISYDAMVPIGLHAFMTGVVVNTNVITVLLGDNWFANVSTKQAYGIAERRIKQCEKMLVDLNKEKSQYENWLHFITKVSDESLVDLREEYDPEKEKLWREQHAKNMKEYKQKSKDTANNSSLPEVESENKVQSIDDYFKRLEILEAEEEEDDDEEDDLTTSEEVEDDDEEEDADLELDSKDEELNEKSESKDDGMVNGNEHEGQSENGIEIPVENGSANQSDTGRHVRWIDLSEAKSKRITFTHSTPPRITLPKKKNRRRRRNSSTSEIEDDENAEKGSNVINSPSDIYKCFSFANTRSKPKSILKSMNSSTALQNAASSFDSTSSEDTNCHILMSRNNLKEDEIEVSENCKDFQTTEKAFTGKIIEHSMEINSNGHSDRDSKPKSLFKRSRNKR